MLSLSEVGPAIAECNATGKKIYLKTAFDDIKVIEEILYDSNNPICIDCNVKFSRLSTLKRHRGDNGEPPTCPVIKEFINKVKDKAEDLVEAELFEKRTFPNLNLFPVINSDDWKPLYICGPSGSGKTYFANEFMKKNYKDKDKILFSAASDDVEMGNYDDPKIQQFEFDGEFITDPVTHAHFKNRLAVFDDIEKLRQYEAATFELLEDILQNGRKKKSSVIYVCHQTSRGFKSQVPLGECLSYVIFPRNTNTKQLKLILESYAGLDTKQIAKVKQLGASSRWVYIDREHHFIMTPNFISTINAF